MNINEQLNRVRAVAGLEPLSAEALDIIIAEAATVLAKGTKVKFKGPSFVEDHIWSDGVLASELTTDTEGKKGYYVKATGYKKLFVHKNAVKAAALKENE